MGPQIKSFKTARDMLSHLTPPVYMSQALPAMVVVLVV